MATFAPSGGRQGQAVTAPAIANVDVATADTEESWTVPSGTIMFRMRARGSSKIQLAFTALQSDTNYVTIYPGNSYMPPQELSPAASVTLYFQTSKDSEVVEFEYWS